MESKIGIVTHYFTNIGVAVFKLTDGKLQTGDTIHIKGPTTDFTQVIEEMQVNHENVDLAEKGSEVGAKINDRVRENDEIFVVSI